MITIVNPDQFIRANRCKGPVTSASFYQGRSESPIRMVPIEEIFGWIFTGTYVIIVDKLNCPYNP